MKPGREFAAFALVGVAGFGVDLGVLYLSAPMLGWYAARVLSFVAAATATWALNRRYTFTARRSDTALWREYLRYLFTMLGGAAVNYAVYAATLHFVEGRWAPALGVALGSCFGLVVNFASARQWVFKSKRDA